MGRLWYSIQNGYSYKTSEEIDRKYTEQAEKMLVDTESKAKLEMLMKKLRGEDNGRRTRS